MIRKRNSSLDDKFIMGLIERLLLPFTRQTMPDIRVDLKTIRKRLNGSITFVAQTAGRNPVGFITMRRQEHMMLIDMLAVDTVYQSKGFGSMLMRKAERTAKQLGCTQLSLWVDEQNPRAQTFYGAKGYSPVHYNPQIRCYLMSKHISD
ncbi:GNAT family N-acetyltransferase [Paenibacillus hamazuiensis]|uniref:GNAT family N-acetyltransferase n=1 Tax=Paenibacillus hamazuiensis TaxID=2936508 RepID=UPI00200E957B|nr:GNAT family N-acetyltransferase [Paenibacillus hamazuiensis]